MMLVQFVGTVAYLFLLARLFSRLRATHTPVWESLGSPSLLPKNNLRYDRRVQRWLWAKGYSGLGDPEAISLAGTVRMLHFTLMANFGVLVLLSVLFVLAQSHIPSNR